jgi:glycosyltransferase involved in cell wall biosynthesis
MKSAKVFLFPSYEEGWGIAVSEALACEIPVVVYDLPAYSYAGNSIIKVMKGNTVAFAGEVIQLLSDEKARLSLSVEAHKKVKDWGDIARDEIAMITQELAVG